MNNILFAWHDSAANSWGLAVHLRQNRANHGIGDSKGLRVRKREKEIHFHFGGVSS